MARRLLLCSAGVAILALTFTSAALADSLVFIRSNNVWIANADGSNARRVTRDGTARYPYESPSEANDGTIVAVRATATTRRRIYRMRQDGRLLDQPVDTPAPGTGAINAKVSPNGRFVAYWFATNVPTPLCPFCVNVASQALISYSSHFTAPAALGTPNTGAYPSWIGNDTLVLTSGSAEVWYYRLGMREARRWFADFETGGQVPIPTLLDAEVSPNGARLAVVRGDNQETVVVYRMRGRPPTRPSPFTANCMWNARTGRLADPTWSSNGQLLALQDGKDIYVVALPSLTNCGRSRLIRVIRGGSQPDFGRALVRARAMAHGVCCSPPTGDTRPRITSAYGVSASGLTFPNAQSLYRAGFATGVARSEPAGPLATSSERLARLLPEMGASRAPFIPVSVAVQWRSRTTTRRLGARVRRPRPRDS